MADASRDLPVLTALSDGIPSVVDTPDGLDAVVGHLAASSAPVAVDTERAQGFRYGAEAWLVQVRRDDVGTFLIDSHALPDLRQLSQVLDAPWVFHSAGQDLPSLEELGMVPTSIFDTEIAARLTGVEHFSLQGTCEEVLGFTLEKAHQNENWSVRPLPKPWLRYAAMDVEVLPALQAALQQRLAESGRQDWAQQEFEYARTHPVRSKEPRWQNLKGVGKLRTPRELAIAKELWTAREQIAIASDVSPGRILNNRGIIAAAQTNPQTKRAMSSLDFFRAPTARRYSDEWWAALRTAHGLTPSEMPSRADLQTEEAVPAFRAWKRLRPTAVPRLQEVRSLVQMAAEPLDLDPEVILLPATQRILAWDPLPHGGAIDLVEERLERGEARPWQREIILDAVNSNPDFLRKLRG